MLQFEFQQDNRELEIEFTKDIKIKYLKVEGEEMEEGEIVHPNQLLCLLQWLKGVE